MMASLGLNAQTTDTAKVANANDSIVACAKAGNDTCQNLLGKWIFEGSHGYQQDYGKAVAWWLQSAKQNNNEAMSNLGFCYLFGLGVDKDTTTATRLFEKALKQDNQRLLGMHDSLATKGSVFSAMFLARCYKMAIGVRRDMQQSLKYYKMAAKQGNVEAMREAAIMMRSNKDDAAALSLFKQAMQKGDVTSTYYYGKMICEGRGATKDVQTGMSCIHQSADKGYAAAQYAMAEAYEKGEGVNKSAIEALEWYKKAALGGNRAAWWQLAECYREGRGTSVDYEEALECYARASEEGYNNKLKALLMEDDSEWKDIPFMHYVRGLRFLQIDSNPNAAIKEFSKLPKQMSHRKTMEALCLMHPSYTKRDVKKAVKLLSKIVDSDNRATYELALMQLKGHGMPKDVAQAEKILTTLANNGYSKAIDFLADAYYDGTSLKKDRTKAILLYLQAEKMQRLTATGAMRLAQAFRNGEGMMMNIEKAEALEKYKAPDIELLLKNVKSQS